MGNEKEEARRRLQLRRAKANSQAVTDVQIVSDFERACWGCVPIFGGLWAFIAAAIMTGVVA